MKQTEQLKEVLRSDLDEFNLEKNDYRILARAVRRLAPLDNRIFKNDYLELAQILNNEGGNFKHALSGLRHLGRLNPEDTGLLLQISRLYQLVRQALHLVE